MSRIINRQAHGCVRLSADLSQLRVRSHPRASPVFSSVTSCEAWAVAGFLNFGNVGPCASVHATLSRSCCVWYQAAPFLIGEVLQGIFSGHTRKRAEEVARFWMVISSEAVVPALTSCFGEYTVSEKCSWVFGFFWVLCRVRKKWWLNWCVCTHAYGIDFQSFCHLCLGFRLPVSAFSFFKLITCQCMRESQ